ncbi:unnamed protein product [Protopolystoma xenopodis]|uniref:Uncharacterized protein n=1 Tax=Protopolystoma xenopodis TaxID=117903 RepID=A0A3S5APG0_9PLAT|nr:unnamed protein product [Protopolystoma xenopodis]
MISLFGFINHALIADSIRLRRLLGIPEATLSNGIDSYKTDNNQQHQPQPFTSRLPIPPPKLVLRLAPEQVVDGAIRLHEVPRLRPGDVALQAYTDRLRSQGNPADRPYQGVEAVAPARANVPDQETLPELSLGSAKTVETRSGFTLSLEPMLNDKEASTLQKPEEAYNFVRDAPDEGNLINGPDSLFET